MLALRDAHGPPDLANVLRARPRLAGCGQKLSNFGPSRADFGRPMLVEVGRPPHEHHFESDPGRCSRTAGASSERVSTGPVRRSVMFGCWVAAPAAQARSCVLTNCVGLMCAGLCVHLNITALAGADCGPEGAARGIWYTFGGCRLAHFRMASIERTLRSSRRPRRTRSGRRRLGHCLWPIATPNCWRRRSGLGWTRWSTRCSGRASLGSVSLCQYSHRWLRWTLLCSALLAALGPILTSQLLR